ncbi:MAG TPA: phosphotransferase [Alphaproteobacteria bacterium]
MSGRPAAITAFLARAGWADAERRRLAGDASFRKYERLGGSQGHAVLMDAPPPMENVASFLAVARHLHALGYSAPRIIAEERAAGLLLIEDLGDDTFTRLLAAGADEAALYALAVDLLIDLHKHPRAPAIELPPYDETRLFAEAALLTDWYLPAVGAAVAADLREDYLARWRAAFRVFADTAPTLVLRDYHVDNLMRLPSRNGVAACGLLDFQDAVLGPPAYDLVSLLEDARRDVAPSVVAAMLERYQTAFPNLDRRRFAAEYAVLGAQRNAKIIGIFTRLMARDGKPLYLAHIPRVWRLLEGDLAHPALTEVRAWFDRHVPPPQRIAPAARVPA